jgi:hypothetical protein
MNVEVEQLFCLQQPLSEIDATLYGNVWVEFDNDWNAISSDDFAILDVSTDGGTTWQNVFTWNDVDIRNTHEMWDISSLVGYSQFLIRLVSIQPGWDWWWAIDNFVVFGWVGYPPPNAPSDLVAIANAPGQVLLNWQDNSDDENGFDIERKLGDSLSSNNYQHIGIVGENITTYVDTTVLDTTLYTYKIIAFNGFAFSHSNQAEVLTLIPVELTSFEGNVVDGDVRLKWATATETNNLGFEIYRTNQNDKQSWKKIGFVQGHGTTTEPQSYSFLDETILSGTYQYRLKQIDYDGSYEYSIIIKVEVGIPTEFLLEQNYPNPFNPTTKIKFSIPNVVSSFSLRITLVVYDVLGNEIATLINKEKEAGIYEVEFSATRITSGIYFYRLTAGTYTATKKMLVIK